MGETDYYDDDNVMIMLDNMTIITSMNSASSPLLPSLANTVEEGNEL